VSGGWYPDTLGAAELRWFDGRSWTWHVSSAGRAWTAPFGDVVARPPDGTPAGGRVGQPGAPPPPPGAGRDLLAVDDFVVTRPAQPRADGAWLDVYDGDGMLGRFVEAAPDELRHASVVRLDDVRGAPILSVVHPGTGGRARVDGPVGTAGFVCRVGRVRSNFELHGPGDRPNGSPRGVLRPLEEGAGWEWHDGDDVHARVRWWCLSEPTTNTYGEARYTVRIGAGVDRLVRLLLLAVPLLVDRLVVQVPHRSDDPKMAPSS
jgi:hypothetical protein